MDQDKAMDAGLKFDYFVTGLAAAVLSYSIQAFPGDAEQGTSLLVASWIFLGIAVLAGIFRSEAFVSAMGVIAVFENQSELLETYRSARVRMREDPRRAILINRASGEQSGIGALDPIIENLEKTVDILDRGRQKWGKWAMGYYHVRRWALILGLGCLAAWKIANL